MHDFSNQDMWVEKYRPQTLDKFVGNKLFKNNIKDYLKEGEIPNLLLASKYAGTGKTSIARLIANSLDADVKEFDGTNMNKKSDIIPAIERYISVMSQKRWKIVIIDECDYLTLHGSQPGLRKILEHPIYSKRARFILTCNYKDRLMPHIISRCDEYEIIPPSKSEVAEHIDNNILQLENITYDVKDLVTIINKCYPDMRKTIRMVQKFSRFNNELKLDSETLAERDYMEKCLNIMKTEKSKIKAFQNIRQTILDAGINNFIPFVEFLYDNISEIVNGNQYLEASLILVLAETMRNDPNMTNKEINIMSGIINMLNEIHS